MICEQFFDDLELYALGALESPAAHQLSQHLATGCPTCQLVLQQALEQNRLISSTVPLVDPPARLRRRLRQAIAPAKPASGWQWLPWAVAAATLLLLTFNLQWQPGSASSDATAKTRISALLQLLSAPGTQRVTFVDAKSPSVHGSLYLHRKLGVALLVDHLSNAPNGWKYESWVVPRSGAPLPVESFQPDANGRALSLVPGPLDPTAVAAIAVSMEPEHSHPVTPTRPVFAAHT